MESQRRLAAQVLSAVFVDVIARTRDAGEGRFWSHCCLTGENEANGRADIQKILNEWQQFLDHLVELDVTEAASLQPLVNGTVIAKELGVKPGRWLTGAIDAAMTWQLRHPENVDASAVLEELRKRKDELGIK